MRMMYGKNGYFKTNLMGYIRFACQSIDENMVAYTIMYVVLVIYNCMFTFIYLKRVLYMAFFTMISPLVALTYPIDKMSDGNAQGFSMWFKEYMMNAVIQPIHLILYTVLISSSISLAVDSPIYALVALGFLIPAEKFIRKMFNLNKGETAGNLGSFAGGALAMQGLQKLGKIGPKSGKGNAAGSSDKIRTQNQEQLGESSTKDFNAWKNNENPQLESGNEPKLKAGINEGEKDFTETGENGYGSKELPLDERPDNISSIANTDIDVGNIGEDRNVPTDGANKIEPDQREALPNNSIDSHNIQSNKPERDPHWKRKIVGRAAKTSGRTLWRNKGKILRTGAKLAGTAYGATVGVAAGLATGDASKVATYAGAGALAGNAIGRNTSNIVSGTLSGIKTAGGKAINTVRNSYNESAYGLEYARNQRIEKENEKYKKDFMKNDDNIMKYKNVAAKIGNNTDYKELMKKAYDYQTAGVTDDKMIENGLKMEAKHQNVSHEQMINVMQAASKRSEADFLDDKKRDAMEEAIKSKVGEEKGQTIMNLTAEAYGQEAFYKRKNEEKRINAEKEVAQKAEKVKKEKAEKAEKAKRDKDAIDAINNLTNELRNMNDKKQGKRKR